MTYIFTDRAPPADTTDVQIVPSRLKGGECATVYNRTNVKKVCAFKINPRIYTSLNHVWPLAPFESPGPLQLGEQTFSHVFCLPWTIQAAKGTYRQGVTSTCWPFDDWWPITFELPPASFEIETTDAVKRLGIPSDQIVPPRGLTEPIQAPMSRN